MNFFVCYPLIIFDINKDHSIFEKFIFTPLVNEVLSKPLGP